MFSNDCAVFWYHDCSINWLRVVIITYQNLSLGMCLKLFWATLKFFKRIFWIFPPQVILIIRISFFHLQNQLDMIKTSKPKLALAFNYNAAHNWKEKNFNSLQKTWFQNSTKNKFTTHLKKTISQLNYSKIFSSQ